MKSYRIETTAGQRRFAAVIASPGDTAAWVLNLRALIRDLAAAEPQRCWGITITLHPADCDEHP